MKKLLLILFIAIIFMSGCSSQFVGTDDRLDYATFVELLEKNGFSFEEWEREEWDVGFLSVLPRRIYIGNEQIGIWEYDSTQAMETDAGFIGIGSSGHGIDNRNTGYVIQVTLTSNPYWFKRDYIIVNYVGTNRRIINFLTEILGEHFAGYGF